MARNLYAGHCYCCGAYVPVGYGHFERFYNPDPKGARWRIKCVTCASGRVVHDTDREVKRAWCKRKEADEAAKNINTGEISRIERYRHCENCKYFAVAEIGPRGAVYGRCIRRKGIISRGEVRLPRHPACKLFEELMEDN